MNKITLRLIGAVACAYSIAWIPAIRGVSASDSPTQAVAGRTAADIASDLKRLIDAAKFRADMATAIIAGDEKPEAAVGRLKASASPSGLRLAADTEFAFAATDLGRRLVAAGKYAEADAFFREAENAFEKLVEKTPDSDASLKGRCLVSLASIRISYLGKLSEAKGDLDAAIKLQPSDQNLRQARDFLGRESGRIFGDQPSAKPPEAGSGGKG